MNSGNLSSLDFPVWDCALALEPAPEATRALSESAGGPVLGVGIARGDYPVDGPWVITHSFATGFERASSDWFADNGLLGFTEALVSLESADRAEALGNVGQELMSKTLESPGAACTVQVAGHRVRCLRFDVRDVGWVVASADPGYGFSVAGYGVADVPRLTPADEALWSASLEQRVHELRSTSA